MENGGKRRHSEGDLRLFLNSYAYCRVSMVDVLTGVHEGKPTCLHFLKMLSTLVYLTFN